MKDPSKLFFGFYYVSISNRSIGDAFNVEAYEGGENVVTNISRRKSKLLIQEE